MNIKTIFEAILSAIILGAPFIIGFLAFVLLIVGGILLQKYYQRKERDLARYIYDKWSKK